jgi:hypothetical protein
MGNAIFSQLLPLLLSFSLDVYPPEAIVPETVGPLSPGSFRASGYTKEGEKFLIGRNVTPRFLQRFFPLPPLVLVYEKGCLVTESKSGDS